VTFSIGLAATLSALGIAVVHAGRVTSRTKVPGWLTRGLPAASALVIVGVGLALTGRALPGLV
ncbi:MAG: ABC transporter permease, partial [Actinomycetes bacterium]